MSRDDDYDHYEPDIPDGHTLCPRCDGQQTVVCHCGGDVPKDERYDRYVKRRAEMVAAFREGWAKAEAKAAKK